MAKPIPVSDVYRNGARNEHLGWSSTATAGNGAGEALIDQVAADSNGWDAHDSLEPSSDPGLDVLGGEPGPAADDNPDLEALGHENARLRTAVTELEQILEEASRQQADPASAERLKEYESLLEEKSEVIRELHRRLKEHQERPAGATPREEELLALSEELERERAQLKEDEETLMQQMRDMEVQMSRERAEIARQRNELQRLQGEIRHELELAGRDSALRERLAPLQRRHQELMSRRGSAPAPSAPAAPAPQPVAPKENAVRKDSSLLRRLFG